MSSDSADPVFEKLSAILVKILGNDIEPVRIDADFVNDLDANSMDMVEIADLAEEMFKVTIRTEDLKQMKTVADVLEYIKLKLT